MIKKLLKPIIIKTFSSNIAQNILRGLSSGCKVLFYHGVEFEILNPIIQSLHLQFKFFEQHITYLKNQYEIISIDDLYDCISNGYKIDPKHVILTFDDGYKNNHQVVFPFLDSMDIPFTVFISTGHVESGDRFPTYILRVGFFNNYNTILNIPSLSTKFDISNKNLQNSGYNYVVRIIKSAPQERVNAIIKDVKNSMTNEKWLEINNRYSSDEPMNWREVDELHSSGISIGSHCHDHVLLHSNQSNKNINKQLNFSKSIIEKRYGRCSYFCYPNGTFRDISPYAYNYIKNEYSLGFTTCTGEMSNTTNKYLLPRIGTPKDLEYFKFIMSSSFIRNRIYKKQYHSFHNTIG